MKGIEKAEWFILGIVVAAIALLLAIALAASAQEPAQGHAVEVPCSPDMLGCFDCDGNYRCGPDDTEIAHEVTVEWPEFWIDIGHVDEDDCLQSGPDYLPTIFDNRSHVDDKGWCKDVYYQLGLRSDGVVVWREHEEERP